MTIHQHHDMARTTVTEHWQKIVILNAIRNGKKPVLLRCIYHTTDSFTQLERPQIMP